MHRRSFLAGLISVVTAPCAAEAQAAGKVWRIGILGVVPRSVAEPYVQALRQGLQDQGWEERNIVIEWASTEGRDDRLSVVAAELVRQRVDVIIAPGDLAGRAAKQATTTIPIVLAPSSDPVATGLVASLARPGGTVTGFSLMATEAYAKRLEIIREIVPGIATVGFLRNPDFPLAEGNWNEVRTAAKTLGLVAHVFDVREAKDFELAFKGMTKAGAAAVVVRGDPLIFSHQALIAELALKNKLASVYEWKEYVHRGGLMAYGPSLLDIYRRAGTFIDKILKGTKPGDLPIEQPTKFELVINKRTAQALGLTIPQSLLLRADQVIE